MSVVLVVMGVVIGVVIGVDIGVDIGVVIGVVNLSCFAWYSSSRVILRLSLS